MDNKNTIKVYTSYSGAELSISAPSVKQVITATNNRAQYFAEQAKKYRDEAKMHRDNAKYYAEQNSDVTYEYINNVKASLEDMIATKQDGGNYALKEELPVNVSELNNDAEYVNKTELAEVRLPSQEGCEGKVLMSDGENERWVGINTYQLFDTKITDRILESNEVLGWALQGTYVYKSTYPDFYDRCISEKKAGTQTNVVLNDSVVSMYTNPNGHQFYDIADKAFVDSLYSSKGIAWFYGIDTENERIFLPRNDYLTNYIADGKRTVNVYGTGKTLGMTNGNIKAALVGGTAQNNGQCFSTAGFNIAVSTTTSAVSTTHQGTFGVVTDPLTSGLTGSVDVQTMNNNQLYVYICVGNTVVNESLVDVGNLSSQIMLLDADKADKSFVDGQWVFECINLCSNLAISTTNNIYDLSTYLPNDEYQYELMMDIFITTGAANGNTMKIKLSTDVIPSHWAIGTQTRAAAAVLHIASFNTIVGSGRLLTIYGSNEDVGKYSLQIIGYRRIGNNL